MSFERWDRPWSERDEAPQQMSPQHTRIVREVRLRDFVAGSIFCLFFALLSLLVAAAGLDIWTDVLRKGMKSRFTLLDAHYATAKILLGAAGSVFFFWLFGRMAKAWWYFATAKPDAYYLRRRW